MDPVLIDADDRQRAKKGSLRSPDFKRMVRLVWPHRRAILVGLIASVIYGFLHSASVVGVLPVLKVLLADEGVHGWLHRTVAEQRLQVTFDSAPGRKFETIGAGEGIQFLKIRAGSPLADFSVRRGDRLVGIEDRPASPLESLETIARADETVRLMIEPAAKGEQPPGEARSVSVRLAPASWEKRFLCDAAGLIPAVNKPSDRAAALACVLALLVVVVALSNVARFVSEYFTSLGVLRGVMDLRRTLYAKVLRLPMDFFTQQTSDIVSRFVQDAQEIQRGLRSLFGKLSREPLRAVFLLGAALYLDAGMTFTMMLIAPFAVVVFWQVGRKIRKANRRLLRTYGLMIGALGTTLDAIDIVKAYNAENVERERLWRIDRRMLGHQLKIVKLEAFLHPMLELLGIVGIAAVTYWLGARVIDRRIMLEDFVALVAVLGMLVDPLRKVADVYPRVMRSAAGAQRIFSVIDAPAEAELTEGAVELSALSDRIEFRKVTFTYPNGAEPALNDVSTSIANGETVAIVGPNGSGKTTLAKMILRFHDPQAGEVLFDGRDIREVKLRSLRQQISLVTQDPVVFGLTVAENIAYGTRHVDREAVEEAARRAHADDFIREKTDGYDELIGERGSTLSGGQRQRLCIARAILRNAPILIFDEATSQIDSESERNIQESLAAMAKDRTTVIIAHRLSTIRFASRIIVMDAGRILDTGRHEELSERCPLYRALCETQLAG
ncbi:MAG TPA: ABC transporter ATP-binding protein [Phycisphaerae bacterium]|nr:ABC transporter ATP-binding protein [Phycisphaerae bacterium]